MAAVRALGPYFEELAVGQVFSDAPAVTLTEGGGASHQAIVGDRLRLPLDHELARRVTGRAGLVHPAYVWNVAIGQSTLATHHVRANLFYRGLGFHRAPYLGDTLSTTTTVVGMRENTRKPGRPPTGLVGLHILTRDQAGRTVLDFHRCAMLPLGDPEVLTGHQDDLDTLGSPVAPGAAGYTDSWDLSHLTLRDPVVPLAAGTVIAVVGGDVVSSAPELARLTLNVAQVHHDQRVAGGTRLVYGGHTIAVALGQVARALPQLVTVLDWASCDHTGPVREGDTLRSRIEVSSVTPRPRGGSVVQLRCLVTADTATTDRPVLDWRFTALCADTGANGQGSRPN